MHWEGLKGVLLAGGWGGVPRSLAPRKGARGLQEGFYVPITFLQQVALLLAAVVLIALELMHAVPSLPALGVLGRRSHRSNRCWEHFANASLYSAAGPLSMGLGAKRTPRTLRAVRSLPLFQRKLGRETSSSVPGKSAAEQAAGCRASVSSSDPAVSSSR